MKRRFVESRNFSSDRRQLERAGEPVHEDIVSLEQRGRARVYYLDPPGRGVTHLVALFGKREKADLLPAERRLIASMVEQLKKEPS